MIISKKRIISLDFLDKYKNDNIKIGIHVTDKEYEKIQDCESIYGTVINLLEPLCDKDTKAIGISNQMHGVLYTDKNARALSPLYTWQDGRGSLEYKNNKTYAEVLGAPSGYGLVTDFYNRENSLVPRDTEYIMTIGDYIALRLCGKTKPTMHITAEILQKRFRRQPMNYRMKAQKKCWLLKMLMIKIFWPHFASIFVQDR